LKFLKSGHFVPFPLDGPTTANTLECFDAGALKEAAFNGTQVLVFAIYNSYMTCPVQTFGQGGNNLGRSAGRDLPPRFQNVLKEAAFNVTQVLPLPKRGQLKTF